MVIRGLQVDASLINVSGNDRRLFVVKVTGLPTCLTATENNSSLLLFDENFDWLNLSVYVQSLTHGANQLGQWWRILFNLVCS